jgi:hypothetical protein
MEQFWALMRALMKLTRYMTKQGYLLGLDDVMLQIADDKLLEFVQSVLCAHKACLKKLGKCHSTSAPLRQVPCGLQLCCTLAHTTTPCGAHLIHTPRLDTASSVMLVLTLRAWANPSYLASKR